MNVDLSRTVYSIYGSYLSLNRSLWNQPLGYGMYLCTHTGRGRKACRELFLLELIADKEPVEYTHSCTPYGLTFTTEQGMAELCLEGECGLRLRTQGVGVRLRAVPDARVLLEKRAPDLTLAHAGGCETRFLIHALSGTITTEAPWEISEGRNRGVRYNDGNILLHPDSELLLQECGSAPHVMPVCPFDEVVQTIRSDWESWAGDLPEPIWDDWSEGQLEAAYITWCSVVAPRGQYAHPVMLMNKTCMDQVWSWDHCFNAMACCRTRPDLSWAQFMCIVDFQDENGLLPDSVNLHMKNFTFTKPPIHGWAYDWCMRENPEVFAHPDRLRVTYRWMTRWSRWWMEQSSCGDSGLPSYLHGNNSGWDNATIFDVSSPTISPDCAAYLSLQCRVLSRMAILLNLEDESAEWAKHAEDLQTLLIDTLWRGDHFVGQTMAGEDIECRSLITCMPIILGSALPAEIHQALSARIESFLTDHGLATEHPESPEFHQHPHAYWRSSVWPPPVMIAVSGLRDAGYHDLARRISERYCRAAAGCGFRENHDPLTGEGRSDYAFTWTASVSLMLSGSF